MMATSNQPRLASKMLKGAGLIKDEDAKMRDLPRTGYRKTSKKPFGHRQRSIDIYKASGGAADLQQKMLASRISSNISNPIAVRGAALRPANLRLGKGGRPQVRPLDVWRELVQKRYDPGAKFLNLERLADDELLKKNRIAAPGQPGSTNKEYPVLFKLTSQLKPPVETISLANNNIQSGNQITSLAHYLPDLRNLSLQGNKLRHWRDVDMLSTKNRRLSQLRELIFLGNPLRDDEFREERAEQYKSGMTRRFPMLEVLDQEAITKIAFDGPVPTSSSSDPFRQFGPESFVLNMAPSFITGVDGTVISSFLSRFFPLFDTQRSALSDAYDPNATFSYSAYTQIPPRARIQGWHTSPAMPNQRKLEWGPWLHNASGGSRNLHFLSGNTSQHGLERELRSLHTGPAEIVRAMSYLPKTRHEVSGAAEKFCIDAWPVGQGTATLLFLCVHGEFAEEPSQGIRSFDRSFILAPATAGSKAALNNWAVIILSDQLTVRPYSSPDAWKPGPLKVQRCEDDARPPQVMPRTPPRRYGRLPPDNTQRRHEPRQSDVLQKMMVPEVQTMLGSIPDPQRALVVQTIRRTKLNVKFAYDCLENNAWDLERAVANFEQVKATLGPEAYL